MVIIRELKPEKIVHAEVALRKKFIKIFGKKPSKVTHISIDKHINANVTDLETAKTYLKNLSKVVLEISKMLTKK